jgi:hypothetical protein
MQQVHFEFILLALRTKAFSAARRSTVEEYTMKFLFAAALFAGTIASFSAADAAGGCGPGFHPTPYGRCVPNRGAVVVAPGRIVVGAPVVVERERVCPRGYFWRYGRCRPAY